MGGRRGGEEGGVRGGEGVESEEEEVKGWSQRRRR